MALSARPRLLTMIRRARVMGLFVVSVAAGAMGGVPAGCGGSLGNGTGAAGATGAAGTSAAAGTTGAAGTSGAVPGAFGEPACATTITRGPPVCGPDDVQLCYKRCGPESVGVKASVCQPNGVYEDMSGCTFDPTRDHSCYKIPAAANSACPSEMTLQGTSPCDIDPCVLCNTLGGLPGGQYVDSTGAPKVGYCVCRPPNDAGVRTWSCASDTSWPCPLGAGC
jgi:hypothetical protein